MSRDRDSHIAAVARDFSEHLRSRGFSDEQILMGIDLDLEAIQEDDAQAPLPAIIALFNRGKALSGDDLIGLKWGQERKSERLGLIGYMGRTSPTLGQLLSNLARFRRVFSEPIEMDVSELAKKGVFAWSYRLPALLDPAQFVESQAAYMLVGFSKAVQKNLRPRHVGFAHNRSHNRAALERFFGCPVQFNAPRNEIVFDPADLKRPILTSDAQLNKILLQHCELVLAQTPPETDDIRQQVERAIADRLATGAASQDQIARDIGLSPRTLARRLDEAGTSYKQVLSNLRRALAERYLSDAQVSQSEVAYLLGYADVSSFATAFKRWTGHSPGAVRHGSA